MNKKLDDLYESAKHALSISSKNPKKAIQQLKSTQNQLKQIKFHLSLEPEGDMIQQRITHLQIIILNNLACAYNFKGKYKASLFHLKLVQDIQNQRFLKHSKSNSFNPKKLEDIFIQQWKSDTETLHQVATTHSNLCAVYSQMGNHQKAIQQIQKAIKYLDSNEVTKNSDALGVFYYNYAIELEHVGQVNEAHKKATKALNLSLSKPQMKLKIQETIDVLEEKMKKRQKKMGQYLASKYKSPFFQMKDSKTRKINNIYSNKLNNSKSIDKNFSGEDIKLPNDIKRFRQSEYPSVYLPKSKPKKQAPLQSHTLIVDSRKKVEFLYSQKYKIPSKNRFSLNKRKETLNAFLKSIEKQ